MGKNSKNEKNIVKQKNTTKNITKNTTNIVLVDDGANNTTNPQIGGNLDKPEFIPPAAASWTDQLLYAIKHIAKLVVYYIKAHPTELSFLLGLVVYIIMIVTLYTKNPYDIITDNNGGLTIFLSLLGGFLILSTMLFYRRSKQEHENVETVNTLSYPGKILTLMGSITVFVAVVILLFKTTSYFSDATSFILFIINALIVIGMLTMAVKYFGLSGGEPSEHKPSIVGLIMKIITYIPCLLLDLIDYTKYQYQITTKPIIIILLIEIVLISLYFLYPLITRYILTHNATQLLTDPKHLNVETNLGTFSEVNYVDDKFQYHYAISCWIYIDSFPPETNPNYDEYTSLINIGNKPNILFNVLKNSLRIKMETQDKSEKIIYETDDFHMQRWNNIIVNYDGSTLDIFINNKLVSSTPGIVPYNDNTMMVSGTVNGLHGGVCNINYFKDNISRSQINWVYNSVKHFNPPVI